jgi:hypothetical protein
MGTYHSIVPSVTQTPISERSLSYARKSLEMLLPKWIRERLENLPAQFSGKITIFVFKDGIRNIKVEEDLTPPK